MSKAADSQSRRHSARSKQRSRIINRPSKAKDWRPYIPQDQLTGASPDFRLAADLIELTAWLASHKRALLTDLVAALEIGQDEYENLDVVIETRDRITAETAGEIEYRARQLGEAYPFALDKRGSLLSFRDGHNWGRTLYLLSLVLSHLSSEGSPVLEQAGLLPADAEVVLLRRWFQVCAAASIAAEIGGDAWTFGWPRPDGSAFLDKLKAIWGHLKDGSVREEPQPGSPCCVKDDEIDIIAARRSCDDSLGFPIILAQVASGKNWRSKPLRGHADYVFYPEWFSELPASQTLVYHVIPFAVDPVFVRRETRRLGHLMHRVRLCFRALEAHEAKRRGAAMTIEGIEAFDEVNDWTAAYAARGASQ